MSQSQSQSDLKASLAGNPPYQAIPISSDTQSVSQGTNADKFNAPQNNFSEVPESQNTTQVCLFIFSLAWAIVFWFELRDVNQTLCPNPVWFWANYAKYYYTVATVLFMLGICFFSSPNSGVQPPSSLKSCTQGLYSFALLCIMLSGLAIIPGFIIAFVNRDQCPDLNAVIWVIFILSCITVGSLSLCCCICICSVCCITSVSIGGVLGTINSVVPIAGLVSQQSRNNAVAAEAAETTGTEVQKDEYKSL